MDVNVCVCVRVCMNVRACVCVCVCVYYIMCKHHRSDVWLCDDKGVLIDEDMGQDYADTIAEMINATVTGDDNDYHMDQTDIEVII